MENRGLKIEDGKANTGAWRLFVAISLPENVKDEIEKAQRELRSALPGNSVRWTKREQFHLTLKFLGNVMESRAAELIEALRGACLNFTTLRLRAEGIGFFPDLRRPRVAWVGTHDEKNVLPRLQQAVEANMNNFIVERAAQPGSAGVSPASFENSGNSDLPPGRRRSQEGAFVGHITLGRIQQIKQPQAEVLAKAALAISGRFFGEWMADTIELIRSELSSGGSRYTTVATIPLSGIV
jgi:2'-5' RNA ligase